MQLVPENDPILRKMAKLVSFPLSDEVKSIIQQMREFIATLESPFSKPAGLAAPQVGISLQIIFFQIPVAAKQIRKDVFDEVPLTVLLNPSYTPIIEADKSKDWEGCYSVPDKMGEVHRYKEIQYQGYTPEGQKVSGTAHGFLARVLQHEIGHLNGQLYKDILTNDCRFGSQKEMLEIRKKEFDQL